MDSSREKIYHELFERMVNTMTDPEHFERSVLVGILEEICVLFNISKGKTEFYRNLTDEKEGNGEVLVDHDDGRGEQVAIRRRIVSRTGAVIIGTLYIPDDAQLPPQDELEKMDRLLRALLSFVSRNRLQNRVETLTFYDEHNYPNLRYFMRHLEQLNEKNRIHNHTAAFFNLRHFSLINRDLGVKTGDQVIRSYYDLLSMAVGCDGVVCRVGGDNFVMIFATELSSEVLSILKGAPVVYDEEGEKRVEVSASAGFFEIPDDFVMERPGDIMERIYPAATAARMDAQNNIVYYDSKMIDRRNKTLHVQGYFTTALKKREFRVFYQPKVDVTTGRIVGAEALCRWFRDGKLVPPMDFIPVLEQSMAICELDYYMLDQVCKDINRWKEAGFDVVRVSVNLSRKHLVDVDLLDHIMKVIDSNKTPHEYIEIELTETTTDVEFRDLKRVVGGLQEAGIVTSVDDFGMGYSSLNLIREVPWNVLKIDRCFLPGDEEKSDSVTSQMYHHVVSMAEDLGLECITEGVETIRQVEILKENGCRVAQGFFFDRPLPVEEFEQRLASPVYEV
ncbi:MAG: GGDEF domain-containing phosphodiesterase [Lachnospiraceae bacterium]|nr:GGDEF domain-containing phosphodiesterase [Lachnospiraceae bacterium]